MNVFSTIVMVVALLAANAFFVASEFALISSRKDRIESLIAQGKKGARKVLYATEHLSIMLAGAQFGITIADKQVITIKNLYKHTDVFAPLVRKQLYVAAPGTSNPNWHELPFRRLPRPIWPLDPDPLGRDRR